MKKDLIMILGGAIFFAGVGLGIKSTIDYPYQPSELRTPVIESGLYLNQDYEEEKAKLSAMQEEHLESVSLWNEEKSWHEPLVYGLGAAGIALFATGFGLAWNERKKTKGIITQLPCEKIPKVNYLSVRKPEKET